MRISDCDLELVCQRLMFGGPEGGERAIKNLISADLPLRELYLEVLNPVMVHLGRLWHEDRATFMSIRVAALRMESLLRKSAKPINPVVFKTPKQAIFASVPGEDHTIGVQMAAELQRAKGWDIQLVIGASHADLLSEIVNSPAQILGLSISSMTSMNPLYTLVRTLRKRCPHINILISGSLIGRNERPFEHLGVSATATNFESAEKLLDELRNVPRTGNDRISAEVTVLPTLP